MELGKEIMPISICASGELFSDAGRFDFFLEQLHASSTNPRLHTAGDFKPNVVRSWRSSGLGLYELASITIAERCLIKGVRDCMNAACEGYERDHRITLFPTDNSGTLINRKISFKTLHE